MTPIYQGVFSSSSFTFSQVTAQANLPNLSDGWHTIMVYGKYHYATWDNTGSARVEFLVGKPTASNSNAPSLAVNSPKHAQAYAENQPIPYALNITLPASWFQSSSHLQGKIYSVDYTLDNSKNITAIAGSDPAKAGPDGPPVMNGSTPAWIPAFSAQNPNIILTGTLPAQTSGNHTLLLMILWSDYGDNIMTANFASHFSVGNSQST